MSWTDLWPPEPVSGPISLEQAVAADTSYVERRSQQRWTKPGNQCRYQVLADLTP